jgi:hypothetical protein
MQFKFTVTVETDTQEHADQVMGERTGYDEDYGFDYQIESVEPHLLGTRRED